MKHKQKKLNNYEHLSITGIGAKGYGIGRSEDGKVIMVAQAVPGDVVNAQAFQTKKNFDYAHLTTLVKSSEDRVEAVCKHFGSCGGCKWQHMGYRAQLKYKQEEVVQNLKKLGKLDMDSIEVRPIIAAPSPYHYRNKMEFSFSNHRWLTPDELASDNIIADRSALGFHIAGQWQKVLDIEQCYLQEEPSNTIRNFVKQTAQSLELAFYDTKSNIGIMRSLMLRNTYHGDWMVVFQFGAYNEKIESLMRAVKENFPMVKSIQYCINTKQNDSIYDQDIQVYWGVSKLSETMNGLTFEIGPKSFFQTNYIQALSLYQQTIDGAGFKGDELVFDLYCGTGTISQMVAKHVKKVVGIESVPEAIDSANKSTQLNNIHNVEYIVGDMKLLFNETLIAQYGKPDVVITDPPRDGMHPKVVAALIALNPQKIVYVSCNVATQARDMEMLGVHYDVVFSQAVDMFPQTQHVENILLLVQK